MHIALALAYPFRMNLRIKFLLYGLLAIYIINVIRIALVGLVYTEYKNINIDHHLVFNIVAYILIFSMMVYSIKLNSINDNTRT
jgi:exosortase/archaeosortase family protein